MYTIVVNSKSSFHLCQYDVMSKRWFQKTDCQFCDWTVDDSQSMYTCKLLRQNILCFCKMYCTISELVGVKLRTKTKRDSDATDCSDSVNL